MVLGSTEPLLLLSTVCDNLAACGEIVSHVASSTGPKPLGDLLSHIPMDETNMYIFMGVLSMRLAEANQTGMFLRCLSMSSDHERVAVIRQHIFGMLTKILHQAPPPTNQDEARRMRIVFGRWMWLYFEHNTSPTLYVCGPIKALATMVFDFRQTTSPQDHLIFWCYRRQRTSLGILPVYVVQDLRCTAPSCNFMSRTLLTQARKTVTSVSCTHPMHPMCAQKMYDDTGSIHCHHCGGSWTVTCTEGCNNFGHEPTKNNAQ